MSRGSSKITIVFTRLIVILSQFDVVIDASIHHLLNFSLVHLYIELMFNKNLDGFKLDYFEDLHGFERSASFVLLWLSSPSRVTLRPSMSSLNFVILRSSMVLLKPLWCHLQGSSMWLSVLLNSTSPEKFSMVFKLLYGSFELLIGSFCRSFKSPLSYSWV